MDIRGVHIYIGVDDTDSINGMCTTYLATELIREFSDYDVIGNPRLVRLNPNVPWKTRGNAAVSILFGKGQGQKKVIGNIDGKDIMGYYYGVNTPSISNDFERACEVVKDLSMFDDEKTNPGIVMYDSKPSERIYWQAVRGIVTLEGLWIITDPQFKRGYKNGRGLIGATAAVSWKPRDRTYELIAYREKNKWGTKRKIDEASVIAMDKKFYSTFNNYDYEEKHVVIAPSSPCPILFGIRGDNESTLPKAMDILKTEKADRWLIYLTNQGTDDHIIPKPLGSLEPYSSIMTSGMVSKTPKMIAGGHLIFGIFSRGKEVDCTIYEPAKKFRDVGMKLRVGDVLTILGGVREKPFTINVEKIHVDILATHRVKVSNPICSSCGKSMKSIGRDRGYRCAKCGTKAGEEDAEFMDEERELDTIWYEPTVSSLRHLAMPLKRMSVSSDLTGSDK
ncbi:MAG: DUF1743 domain-containing protein [Thermoplasmata archaeon]|nr:DUF1743 domain-containing protein [Thermoplasmata archaeon]